MKYLYILVLVILGFNAMAQEPPYTPMRNNYLFRGVRIDSLFLIPHFSDTTSANVNLNSINGNLIRIDSLVYMRWNGAWISIGGSSKSNSVDSIYRTPGIDSFYYTKQANTYSVKDSVGSTDTTSLSNRINTKLNISDTTTMLSPYLKKADTLSLSDRINLKLNASDTTSLSNRINLKLNSSDTASLSNRINTKLSASDTTGHWVNNITRTLGKDSIIYYIGSTRYAIKDSVGMGNGRFGNDTATVILAKVHNDAGSTLTNGEVVYLATSGTNSEAPAVKRANNKADSTSANTFGFVLGSIANQDTGYIILSGKIEKLNTAAFSNGDIIYLDSISGKWTKSKPKAPYHLVYLGVVVKSNAGNGSIFVKCQNGYELDEIHDVQITSVANNQIIVYSDTQKVWKNRSAYSVIDTSSLSNRINLKLNAADTASLSTRINAKQNTLTNPVTGTGTTGAIAKFSGTSTIGDATADVDYLQQDMSLVAYQAMGSSIKGYNIAVPNVNSISANTALGTGQLLLYPIYIPKTTTITGVKWYQGTQGAYTANNYNGVALYSVSGGTLTRVDSSANDGNIWKATSGAWTSKAFSFTYSAAPGIYYVAALYSSSAATAAPQIGAGAATLAAAVKYFDFTNSLKLNYAIASQTLLLSTISASSTQVTTTNYALYLY